MCGISLDTNSNKEMENNILGIIGKFWIWTEYKIDQRIGFNFISCDNDIVVKQKYIHFLKNID